MFHGDFVSFHGVRVVYQKVTANRYQESLMVKLFADIFNFLNRHTHSTARNKD